MRVSSPGVSLPSPSPSRNKGWTKKKEGKGQNKRRGGGQKKKRHLTTVQRAHTLTIAQKPSRELYSTAVRKDTFARDVVGVQ